MKKNLICLLISIAAAHSLTAMAHATCASAALWAAETEYGNDPVRTYTKTLVEGEKYRVTVGIGNVEDGAHYYIVEFKNGVCDPKTAIVTEVNE